MMKKGILIGVLAVLMLMAFTACEQSPTTPLYGKQVDNITVASQPDYIINYDSIKGADVKLTVNYNDGSSSSYTAAELKYSGNDKVTAADTPITVKLNDQNYTVLVKAYEKESEKINLGASEAGEYDLVAGKFTNNTDGSLDMVKTVAYNGGKTKNYAVSVSDDALNVYIEVVKAYLATEAGEDVEAGDSVTISKEVIIGWLTSAAEETGISIPQSYIDEISKNFDENYIGSWTVKFNKNSSAVSLKVTINKDAEFFANSECTILDILSKMSFAVVDGTGKATPIASEELDDWSFSVEKYTDDYNFDTVGTKTVTIVATKANGEGEADDVVIKAENVKIEIINDYPVEYTVSQNKNSKDEYDEYAWKEKIEAKNFTFTASVWASGYEDYKDDPAEGELKTPTYTKPTFTAVPSIIPEGTSTTGLYEIPFIASDESVVEWATTGGEGLEGVTVVEKHE